MKKKSMKAGHQFLAKRNFGQTLLCLRKKTLNFAAESLEFARSLLSFSRNSMNTFMYLSPVSTQRFAFILVANVIGEFWKVDNGFSLKYCVLIKIHQIITFISAFLSVQFFFRETEVYFQSTSDILIIPLLFQIRFSGIFFGKLPTPPPNTFLGDHPFGPPLLNCMPLA